MNQIIKVIDVETTGVDPEQDAVVEIASIDINAVGFTNPVNLLVNPQKIIPPTASAIHGIIDEDVTNQPVFSESVKQFEGADYYVAHNAKFDSQFLPFDNWICTMKCAARVWPDAPGYSNQVLRYWRGLVDPLGIDRNTINPHRAISDVYVTGALFLDLQSFATLEQMIEWSQQPMLIHTVTFGKHRGQKLSEVPADYLQWVTRSDFDEDVKWNASEELKRRQS